MDIYTRNKMLTRLVLVLVLINVLALSFIWWQSRHRPGREKDVPDTGRMVSLLREKLDLRDDQVQKLYSIREEFFGKEKILAAVIRAQRDSMNVLMFSERTDTVAVESIARRVAENEYAMEMLRLGQATLLQSVLDPEQSKKLNGLVREVRDFFKPDNDPKKREPSR